MTEELQSQGPKGRGDSPARPSLKGEGEHERFSASDLEPNAGDRRAAFKARVERIATVLAVTATGLWVGGLVALGACAAPAVFHLTPSPYSGNAMGAAFA